MCKAEAQSLKISEWHSWGPSPHQSCPKPLPLVCGFQPWLHTWKSPGILNRSWGPRSGVHQRWGWESRQLSPWVILMHSWPEKPLSYTVHPLSDTIWSYALNLRMEKCRSVVLHSLLPTQRPTSVELLAPVGLGQKRPSCPSLDPVHTPFPAVHFNDDSYPPGPGQWSLWYPGPRGYAAELRLLNPPEGDD